jgi:putative protein-disulfide isomerase
MDRALVYVTDPMCSWCWGFAPVIEQLRDELGLPLEIVAGGLEPGDAARLVDDEAAAYIGEHWVHVEQASGQPFDHRTLDRRGWRYDTELACRALVVARERAPDRVLGVLHALQEAFYVDGTDITDLDAYGRVLDGVVPDVAGFLHALAAESSRAAAWQDFAWARQRGLTSFPTLLARKDRQLALVTRGWAPAERLLPVLRAWSGEAVDGDACALDGC